MKIDVLYEDKNLLVVDKPYGVVVFSEEESKEKSLIDHVMEEYPELKEKNESPRYGIIHRLDKDTSGILLIAKDEKSLNFYQKQFKNRDVVKKYIALVVGEIKNEKGKIETLIGRSNKNRKKQKVYLFGEPNTKGKRDAITRYKVLERFENKKGEKYTLIEAKPETGRKHQIRVHLSYLNHPIAGDKVYSFKNQSCPKDLKRHFLHSTSLEIKLLNKKIKKFNSKLPKDLKTILCQMK